MSGKHKRQSYGRTAKVGALWSVARQVVNHGIALPAAMMMARLLTPREFGIAAAAAFFVSMANRVTELGLNAALVRVKELRSEHSNSVFVASLLLGVLAWLGLTLAGPFVGEFFRSPEAGQVLPVAAIAFLFAPLSTVPSAIIQRELKFQQAAATDWMGTLTQAFVAVTLAWIGFSFWSLVYAQLAATAITVASRMYLARWVPRLSFSWSALRELLSFGLGIQSKRLLEFAAQNLDNLVVGRVLGIAALGLYDKAFMTTQKMLQLLNMGPAVSFRIFAIIQDEAERFRRAYQRMLTMVTLIGAPILFVCIAVAPQLFEVLYGPRWLQAVPAFQVLCAATVVKLLSAHATRANEAKGMIWQQVAQHIIYVVMIIIGVWLGSRWGLFGAAAGVLVARIMLAILIQHLLLRSMGATWRQMLAPLVPGLVCSGAVVAVVLAAEVGMRHYVGWSAWQLLLVQVPVAALSYAAFILFAPFAAVREIVRETLEEFLPGVARRFGFLPRVQDVTTVS